MRHAHGHYKAKVGIKPRTTHCGVLYSTTRLLHVIFFSFSDMSQKGWFQRIILIKSKMLKES